MDRKNSTGYYRKNDNNLEYVNIKLIDSDQDEVDIESIRKTYKKLIMDNKDKIEKIIDFGIAVTGDHYKAIAFMNGWVIHTIISNYEKVYDTKISIVTENEKIDEDEIKEKTIEMMYELIQKIENDELDLSDIPGYIDD